MQVGIRRKGRINKQLRNGRKRKKSKSKSKSCIGYKSEQRKQKIRRQALLIRETERTGKIDREKGYRE